MFPAKTCASNTTQIKKYQTVIKNVLMNVLMKILDFSKITLSR